MDRFGIVTNKEKDTDYQVTAQICRYLAGRGKQCLLERDFSGSREAFAGQLDAILVLGGDGTLIRAARAYAHAGVPMLGINLGTLGYLTAVEPDDICACLDDLIGDNYTIEERMMLCGTAYSRGQAVCSEEAVNDVVVSRSGFSRLVELRLYVNHELVDIYAADGIIVSSPTGSTGYNLSAGGPVVYPETSLLVITPICPHSLTARSIVVSGRERITIEIGRRSLDQPEEAMVTYDGQGGARLGTGDRVEIGEAGGRVRLIKVNNRNFYQILRNKMGNV